MAEPPPHMPIGSPNSRGRVFGRKISAEKLQELNRRGRRKPAAPKDGTSRILLICTGVMTVFIALVAGAVFLHLPNEKKPSTAAATAAPPVQAARAQPAEQVARPLPSCDSRAVNKAVMQRLDANMKAAKWNKKGFQVRTADLREVESTPDGRTCSLELRTPTGNVPVVASIRWQNMEKGRIEARFDSDPVQKFTRPK